MKRTIIGTIPAFAVCLLIGCNRGTQAPDVLVSETLHAYRGKELVKLNEAETKEILATIKILIPGREYRHWFDFQPWYVWEFPNKGQPVLVLFEVDDTGPHPGSTGIRINVFEKTANVLSESKFWTGHRCYMRAVSLEKQAGDEDPLVVLETGFGPGPGPNVRKQIYARIGNRFDLVRLEDADGKARRNNYYVKHFACGPTIPNQTPAQWEADVLSGDRMRTLRALVWLGGAHWEGDPPDKSEAQHEPAEQIELVRTVRANQKVVAQLKALAKSDDRWVSEAAALAADPKDIRWGW